MPLRSANRRVRALRGTTAAAIATTTASTGHTFGGGDAPPLWLIAAVTVLTAPIAVALIGRRRSLPRLAAAITAAQVALHAIFAAVGSAPSPAAGTGHVHESAAVAAAFTNGNDHAAGHFNTAMLIAHAVAALVTIGIVAYGERLLAVLAGGIRRVLNSAHVPAPHSFPRITVPSFPPRAARAETLLSVLTRRGPPAFSR